MVGRAAILVATGALLACACLVQSKTLSLNDNFDILDESRHAAPSDAMLGTFDNNKSEASSTLNPSSVNVRVLAANDPNPSRERRVAAPSGRKQDITADKLPQDVSITMEVRTVKIEVGGGAHTDKPSEISSTVVSTNVNQDITADKIAAKAIKMNPKTFEVQIADETPVDNPPTEPNMVASTDVITTDGRISSDAITFPRRAIDLEEDLEPSIDNLYEEPSMFAPTDVNEEYTKDEMYNEATMEPRKVNIEEAKTGVNKPSGDLSTVARNYVKKVTRSDKISCKPNIKHRPINLEEITRAIDNIIGEQSTIIIQNADPGGVVDTSNTTVAVKPTGDKLSASMNTTEDKQIGESSRIQLVILQIEDIEDATECNGTSTATSKTNTRGIGPNVGAMPRTMMDVTKESFEHESEVNTNENIATIESVRNKDTSPRNPSLIVRKSLKRKEVALPKKDEVIREPRVFGYKYETNEPSGGEKPIEHIGGNEGETESRNGGTVADRVKEDPNAVNEGEEDDNEEDYEWEDEDEPVEEGASGGRIGGDNEKGDSNVEEEEEEEEHDDDELFKEDSVSDQNEVVEKDARVVNVVKSEAVSGGTTEGNKTVDETFKRNVNYWRPLLQQRPKSVK